MKARRYIRSVQSPSPTDANPTMNPSSTTEDDLPQEHLDESSGNDPQAIEVDVGKAMPSMQAQALPTLGLENTAQPPIDATDASLVRSLLAEGMQFVGNATLKGPCSIAGHIEGNVAQAQGVQVSVVVTETGRVKGDIVAHKISVMGHTDGLLDSGDGEVSLHDSATVHGLVRYGRIQVNGADLNATLERVPSARKNH